MKFRRYLFVLGISFIFTGDIEAKKTKNHKKLSQRKMASVEAADKIAMNNVKTFNEFIECGNKYRQNQAELYSNCGLKYFHEAIGEANIRNYLSLFRGELIMSELFYCDTDTKELIANSEDKSLNQFLCFESNFKGISSTGIIFFLNSSGVSRIAKIKI